MSPRFRFLVRDLSGQSDSFGQTVFFDANFKAARSVRASQDGLPWRPEKPRT